MNIGDYVLVRTDHNIYVGHLRERTAADVTLVNARHVTALRNGSSLAWLARYGVGDDDRGRYKISMPVREILLSEPIEIIVMTEDAQKSIEGFPIKK